jgi:hypothetical protein
MAREAPLFRLAKELYKDFGKPLVDEVAAALGKDVEPEVLRKAVTQRAKADEPAAPVKKAAPAKAVKEKPPRSTAPSPFAITGKADPGQKILQAKAAEMEIKDPKKRTQPTGTEPVFDLSPEAYEETTSMFRQSDPLAVQARLPRPAQGAKLPLDERMLSVMRLTPQIAERLAEKSQIGRGTSQEFFYHTAPIVRGIEEMDVPLDKAKSFLTDRFAPAFAGTSPRTATEQNMRNASMILYLQKKGIPIDEAFYDQFGNAKGYNMMGGHYDLAGQMLAGTHNPLKRPKPSAFLRNTAGDLSDVTADTHNIRGTLLAMDEVEPGSISSGWFKSPEAYERYRLTGQFNPASDINDSLQSGKVGGVEQQIEYGPLSDVTFEASRLSGVAPAPMQSLGWFGSGVDTGLKSETKTIAELMNERVNVAAQILGIPPKQALRLLYESDIPTMAEGGGVDASAMAHKYGC